MATLADASLSEAERLVVERLVGLLRERLGDRLRSVWLFGSRARGEVPGPESDIDLIAIAEETDDDDALAAIMLVDRAAEELRLTRPMVSIIIRDSAWLAGRREIDSFFVRELDADKVVLYGER